MPCTAVSFVDNPNSILVIRKSESGTVLPILKKRVFVSETETKV